MPNDNTSANVWGAAQCLIESLLGDSHPPTSPLGHIPEPAHVFLAFDPNRLAKLRALLVANAEYIGLPQLVEDMDWRIFLNPKHSGPDCDRTRWLLLGALYGLADAGWAESFKTAGVQDRALGDPIPVIGVVKAVGRKAGRSDKLADRMKRRNYPVVKRAGKLHCQRADAIAMFPRFKQRIEEI